MVSLLERCRNYNQNRDLSAESEIAGSEGSDLAEEVYQMCGSFEIKDVIEKQNQWEKWKAIASKEFDPLGARDKLTQKDFIVRLRELKQAGYDIQSGFSRLTRNEARDDLKRIKRNIRTHLENLS